jgi:hypothetical protein
MTVVDATKVLAENGMQSDIVNGCMMIYLPPTTKKLKPSLPLNQKQKITVFFKNRFKHFQSSPSTLKGDVFDDFFL